MEKTVADWEDAEIEHYNEVEYFDEVIKPKLDELLELCQARGIPIYATLGVAQDHSGYKAQTMTHAGEILGRVLPNMMVAVLSREIVHQPIVALALSSAISNRVEKAEKEKGTCQNSH